MHFPGMDMFTVCVCAEQFVWMVDDENIIELHHKIHRKLCYNVKKCVSSIGNFHISLH